MNRAEFQEYLSEALGEINEDFIQDAINTMLDNNSKKKNTQKKLLALAVTVIAVRGIAKYINSNELKVVKR